VTIKPSLVPSYCYRGWLETIISTIIGILFKIRRIICDSSSPASNSFNGPKCFGCSEVHSHLDEYSDMDTLFLKLYIIPFIFLTEQQILDAIVVYNN